MVRQGFAKLCLMERYFVRSGLSVVTEYRITFFNRNSLETYFNAYHFSRLSYK